MGKSVTIETEELTIRRKKLEELFDKFDSRCIECVKRIDETRDFFSTDAGNYFRDKVTDYVYAQLKVIDETVENKILAQVDGIIASYDALDQMIKVKGGKSNE